MKILFVMSKMDLGGTEKALLSLLATLENHQVHVTLLILEKGGLLTNQIPPYVKVKYLENFEIMRPNIVDPPRITVLKKIHSYRLFDALHFLLLYIKIKATGNWFYIYKDVLKAYSHFGSFDVAVAFAGPADFITYFVHEKVSAKKKIQWIHFDIEKVIANFNFGKKYYPFFDNIFCVSQSARDIFLKHFPQMTNKTEVFHNIVSESELKKQANEGETYEDGFDGIRVLTVGRFTREKGQHLIPMVVKRLKEHQINFRWYLVGNGKEKAAVEQMAHDLGLENDLVFLGEKANPYRYMQDCDVYVQPSLHEGYGITVAEAKVFNKPMVITNFASAKDLIKHGETGLISEISAHSLYTHLYKLTADSAMMVKFKNNLEKSKPGDNSDEMVTKLLQI